MSMTTLVTLRFVSIFAAYTGLTVLLPAIMFPSDTGRQKTVRAVSDVLYIWKFLYYKYRVCSPAFAYFRFLGACIVYCCTRDSDLEQGEQSFLRELCIKTGIICKKILQGSMGMRGFSVQSKEQEYGCIKDAQSGCFIVKWYAIRFSGFLQGQLLLLCSGFMEGTCFSLMDIVLQIYRYI